MWLLFMMTTLDTLPVLYVRPFVDDIGPSLTPRVVVTQILPARYFHELPSEIRTGNMSSRIW